MVLEITNQNNCYAIKGQLTRFNLQIFTEAFSNIFDSVDQLQLNFEELYAIDRQGIRVIAELHNESLRRQKRLIITGLDSSNLNGGYTAVDAA